MKVNLKKLGAVVAGAAILASSVAFAALPYGNMQLVNENGAPQVKIVVGEKAAASDGVAAANIAAKIASEAYKIGKHTASYTGTGSCAAGKGSDCILSDKKVVLEFTVPETVQAGTYTWGNLLGDYMNKELLDKEALATDTSYKMGTDDLSEFSSPFTSGSTNTPFHSDLPSGTTTNTGSGQHLYKITGTMFEPLKMPADYPKIKDTYAGLEYSETQNIWIVAPNTVAYYSSADDQLVSSLEGIVYSVKFDGPGTKTFGIPICAKIDSGTDYSTCPDSDKTAAHKVKIMFLGSKWVISEMVKTDTAITSEDSIKNGGSITLAEESIGGVIKKTEALKVEGYEFVLDDVEVAGTSVSAAISVKDAAGNEKTKKKITQGSTADIVVDGKTYRVHVYQAVGGITWAATWADMAIYAKEMKLEDGEELPPADKNKGWKVYLGWKNRGATATANTSDHLRTIVVYGGTPSDIINTGEDYMIKNNYVDLPTDSAVWRLKFNGIDLKSGTDYDTLKFTSQDSTNKILSGGIGGGTTGGNVPFNSSAKCTLQYPYVEVSSSVDNAFKLSTAVGDAHFKKFYVATSGVSCEGTGQTYGPGAIFMKRSGTIDGYYATSLSATTATLDSYGDVVYNVVGDGSETFDAGGIIRVVYDNVGTTVQPATNRYLFVVNEKVGVGVSDSAAASFIVAYDNRSTAPTFNPSTATTFVSNVIGANDTNTSITTKENEIYYINAADDIGDNFVSPQYTSSTKEEGFVSERGSIFKDVATSSVTFSMAKKLGKASYTLASTKVDATTSETTQKILTEGDTYPITTTGISLKVLEISAKGTCAAGTGAAPTCDMTKVSPVIIETGTATAAAKEPFPYAGYGPLVYTDKDALALGVEAVITVGGPAVNDVTQAVISGTDFTAATVDGKVVKQIGKKIVVAGITAADTTAAAQDFINALKRV